MGKYFNPKMIVAALIAVAAWDVWLAVPVKKAFKK